MKVYEGLCVTERVGDDSVKCECTCPECGKHQECVVKLNDLENYKAGIAPAYKVFRYLLASEREMFLTGLCNDCWEKLIGEDY